MSKINELIQTLCPDGVEYKLFGDVASICRGASPRPIKQFVTEDVNGVNWIKIGDTKVGSKYITETAERITEAGAKKSRYVHIGDFIMSNSMSFGRPYICQIEGCIHDGWLAISEFHDSYNSDFLYYLLCSTVVQKMMEKKASNGGAVSNLNADIVRALELPVPPRPVQEEIVRILDEYTELEAELEAKLSEEIKLKQKQYEFYRDELLTFGDDVERKKLGEVATINRGNGFQKKDFTEEGKPCIHYGQIFMHYSKLGIATNKTLTYLDNAKHEKNVKALQNDVVMAVTSENVEDVCKCVVWEGDEPVAVSGHTAIFHTEMNSKFLAYWFNTSDFYVQKVRLAHGTKVIEVTPAAMADIILPVPSLTEQQHIVEILDKYDTYTRDMISTLNTELESRKKQYAYYRDQLLTFKRKEV